MAERQGDLFSVKLSPVLLVILDLLAILSVVAPPVISAAPGPAQEPLQTLTVPYTWTISRGPVPSYTIPVGPQYVSYQFSPNGTLSYSGFTVKPLSAKWGSLGTSLLLPFTSLRYNSTVVEYVLDVTVLSNSLTLVVSYRQIPGTVNLLVSYSGTLSAAGILSVQFSGSGRKLLVNQTLTWGSAGYDWSDAISQSPVFNNATNTVTLAVSSLFTIDPVTLGTSAVALSNEVNAERHIFVTPTGVIYVIWYDGINVDYADSPDGGVTWTSATVLTQCAFSGSYSMWYDGSYVYQVCQVNGAGLCGANSGLICWRTGTLTGSGTSINWNSWASLNSAGALCSPCGVPMSIASDTTGHIWISVEEAIGAGSGLYLYQCACTGSASSWTNATGFPKIACTAAFSCIGTLTPSLLPLTNGKMALAFPGYNDPTHCGCGNILLNMTVWNSAGLVANALNADPVGPNNSPPYAPSSVAVGDDVWTAYLDYPGNNLVSDVYHYSSNKWDPIQNITLGSFPTSIPTPALTYEAASQTFYAFWILRNTQTIYYATHGLTSTVWSDAQSWIANVNIPGSATNLQHQIITSYNAAPLAPVLNGYDVVPVVYEETHVPGATSCTSNGCDVRYQGLLINVQPPNPQPISSPVPGFHFDTITLTLPLIGNVTLPAELVHRNTQLLALVLGFTIVVSSTVSVERRKRQRTSLV